MSFNPSTHPASISEASYNVTVIDTRDNSSSVFQLSPVEGGLRPEVWFQGVTIPETSASTTTRSGLVRRGNQTFSCTVTEVSERSTERIVTIYGQPPAPPGSQPQVTAVPAVRQTHVGACTNPEQCSVHGQAPIRHRPFTGNDQGQLARADNPPHLGPMPPASQTQPGPST